MIEFIEFMLGPFDWLLTLPIQRLFHLTTGLSLSAFCFAAILRELFTDHGIRWAARMVGAGAIFVSVCFGNYATHKIMNVTPETAEIQVPAEDTYNHNHVASRRLTPSAGDGFAEL